MKFEPDAVFTEYINSKIASCFEKSEDDEEE